MSPGDDVCSVRSSRRIPIPATAAVVVVAAALAFAFWVVRRRRRRWRRRRRPIDDAARRLAAKLDFLERTGGRYGYAGSPKGFVDDWRPFEFPTLISPLPLSPRRLLRRSRRRRPPSSHASSSASGRDRFDDAAGAVRDDEGSDEPEEAPEVYLDYAGSAIPTRTLRARMSDDPPRILANPHSRGGGIASDRTLRLMQASRDRTLRHFGVRHEAATRSEPEEEGGAGGRRDDDASGGYRLVFTSGATDSLRLVAERFPWSSLKVTDDSTSRIASHGAHPPCNGSERLNSVTAQSILLFPRNAHTSVIGMREIALQRGARFRCVSAEALLGATFAWFRELTSSGSPSSRDCREVAEEEEEKKSDHRASSISENASDDDSTTPCETLWVHHLLVLPLECNFGGDRFDWSDAIAAARESSRVIPSHLHSVDDGGEPSTTIKICHRWHVLIDAAKAAATGPVDLPALAPDFAVVSFYKMFGTPTGLGALFVRNRPRRRRPRGNRTSGERRSINELEATRAASHARARGGSRTARRCGGMVVERSVPPRQFFGGGSVDVVLAGKDFVVPRNARAPNGMMSNDEDEHIDLGMMVHGTEHFRGIASLSHGFRELDELGGMDAISSHSTCLAMELVRRLGGLVHDNGEPVVRLYGRWNSFVDDESAPHPRPGPTVAFNVFDRDGAPIGYDEVSRLAALNRPPIQLRTGCFCNPGACQDALSLTDADALAQYASGHVCGDRRGVVDGRPTGAVRASFGKDSLWEDMDALVSFVDEVFRSRGRATEAGRGSDESSDVTVKIDRLFVYPIKSCAAMRVNGGWPIDRQTGRLAFDREFALVDASGSAMRLHSYPKMSAIRSAIDLNAKKLTVAAPNHEDLIISLEDPNPSSDRAASPEDIQVCGALCKGDVCADAAGWFGSVLGVRCWLARHHAGAAEKDSDGRYAYCNEAPLLVVSQRSVSFLNSVVTSQGWGLVEPRHFRPNVVVSSIRRGSNEEQTSTNPEDSWQRITVKNGSAVVVELKAVGKCARCQMVDIDPSSGMKGNTLRALAQYRRTRGQIHFGIFFAGNTDSSEGNVWLEEGNEVHVSSATSKCDP